MNKGNYNVLGLRLTACDTKHILSELESYLKRKHNFIVGPLPVNQIILAFLDKKFRFILNKFNYLVADGIWVRKSLNFLYNLNLKERVRGSDLTLNICRIAEKNRLKIFLYGSTDSTLKKLKAKLNMQFPLLIISGYLAPPYRKLNIEDKKILTRELYKKQVDILFIALGTPNQEKMAYNLLYKNPSYQKPIAIIPVGAVFDFISGAKLQAPQWLQNTGFEWLFRLICEPKRLWKRYLIYGPMFFYLIFKQKMSSLIFKK